jgi:AGZA family xanthine/uracil permease-like MFS transporter
MPVVPGLLGIAPAPGTWTSRPPDLSPILFHLDIRGALRLDFFGVTLSLFVMALTDTMGSLVGVAAPAGLLDPNGKLPQIERPMMADALSTIFASLVGTTTAGAYIESAAGVSVGGRTGLAAIATAALFAISLVFAPIVTAIPPAAYGPALIVVGSMMVSPITQINFDDAAELLPAFAIIALMSFTYNAGVGITAGLVLYPLFKLIQQGRAREVGGGCGRWPRCHCCSLCFIHTAEEDWPRTSAIAFLSSSGLFREERRVAGKVWVSGRGCGAHVQPAPGRSQPSW